MRDRLATYIPNPQFAGSVQTSFRRLEISTLRKYPTDDLLPLCALFKIVMSTLDEFVRQLGVGLGFHIPNNSGHIWLLFSSSAA